MTRKDKEKLKELWRFFIEQHQIYYDQADLNRNSPNGNAYECGRMDGMVSARGEIERLFGVYLKEGEKLNKWVGIVSKNSEKQ